MSVMHEDPDTVSRRIAWIDEVRSLHKRKKDAAFIGCLLGVVLLGFGRLRPEAPEWTVWAGFAVVGASWLLFAYVIVARSRYVRAHPFDAGN